MSYTNAQHFNRLILMPLARMAFESPLSKAPCDLRIQEIKEEEGNCSDTSDIDSDICDLHHYPFLFHADGVPWHEANSYLLSLVIESNKIGQRADSVRRLASKLLDYIQYCERNNLDWLDFSGRRPALRPTYKYFNYLINESKRSNQVVNQYTSAVYNFYSYVSEHWHQLDMARIDTIKKVRFVVNGPKGGRVLDVLKRSQTMRTSGVSMIPLGFVRENCEDLRPLSNNELSMLMNVINGNSHWSSVERIILLFALLTGARKQSVLTLRMRHLGAFSDADLLPESAYKIYAGAGTGIDTKYDKPQVLYVPKVLAEELITMACSPLMTRRREKFLTQMQKKYPDVKMDEEDIYLFLSPQGNCYYMAEDDPRYALVKCPPTGQVTETLKRKILRQAPSIFPRDFSYHWLRATYAYQLYQRLQAMVRDGVLKYGDDIAFIQKRMHHESRETTENYLKLFNMTQEKVVYQELYEEGLFKAGDVAAVGHEND